MNVETLDALCKQKEDIEKKITELENVLDGDGIWCKRCGCFVPTPSANLAYITEHAQDGHCYSCRDIIRKEHNKDRIMKMLGHGVYIIDVEPWEDDGDSIRSLTFFNERNQYWKINIQKNGKIENLKYLTNKEV